MNNAINIRIRVWYLLGLLIKILYLEKGKKEKSPNRTLIRPGNVLDLLTLFLPLQCLTSVFGMGTGVATAPSSPDLFLGSFAP